MVLEENGVERQSVDKDRGIIHIFKLSQPFKGGVEVFYHLFSSALNLKRAGCLIIEEDK